jgi:site-specific DNA recombinase
MKKVIGYVRVSSEIQKLKENSIKNQINEIRNYSNRCGFELVEIFEDLGISGLKSDRKGLEELLNKVRDKNIDGVVVYSLSRMSRKLRDVIDIIDLFSKNDVEFYSIKEGFMNDGIVGKLMLNILGSINEFEVNVLGERIKDVKNYKKSKNEVYGGKILYGMYRRKNKLVRNKAEIEVLRQIKDFRINKKWSYFKISAWLNNNNILSKEKKQWYGNSVRSVYLNGVIEKFKI